MVPNPLNSRNLTMTLQSQFPVDTMPPSPADQVNRDLKAHAKYCYHIQDIKDNPEECLLLPGTCTRLLFVIDDIKKFDETLMKIIQTPLHCNTSTGWITCNLVRIFT